MNSAHDAQSETANAKTSDSDTPATVSDPNAHESENAIASANAPRRRRLSFALKIPVYPAHRSGAAAAETIVPAAARYTFAVNRRDSVPSAAAAAVQSAYLTVSLSQKSAEAASPERKSPFSLACCPLPAAPGSLPRFLPRKTSAHRTALTAQAMSAMRTPPFTLRLPRSTPASEAMKNALPSAAQSAAIPNGYVSSTNGAPDVRAEKTNTAAAGAYFTISSGRADVPKCIFRGGVPPCGELSSPAPTETSSNSSSSLRSSIILSFLSSPSRRLHPSDAARRRRFHAHTFFIRRICIIIVLSRRDFFRRSTAEKYGTYCRIGMKGEGTGKRRTPGRKFSPGEDTEFLCARRA